MKQGVHVALIRQVKIARVVYYRVVVAVVSPCLNDVLNVAWKNIVQTVCIIWFLLNLLNIFLYYIPLHETEPAFFYSEKFVYLFLLLC